MIKLNSLYLDSYNPKDHMSIVRKLNNDQSVYKYISKRFSEWLERPRASSNIEAINNYVIYNDNKEQIGMCGNSITSSNNKIIELWCCINEEYRHRRYAERLLVEITDYFLDTVKDLKNIKLVIDNSNKYSNKVAINSGYSNVDSYDGKTVYQYFKN